MLSPLVLCTWVLVAGTCYPYMSTGTSSTQSFSQEVKRTAKLLYVPGGVPHKKLQSVQASFKQPLHTAPINKGIPSWHK